MDQKLFTYISKINMQLKLSLEKKLKTYKLNYNSFSVLKTLYNNGTNNVSYICEKLIIKNSSMSYVIKKLENKDLIIRTIDQDDKRNFNLKLTNKGIKLMDEVIVDYNDITEALLSNLNESDKKQITNYLKIISKKADKVLD